jgi:hypothetical protein
MKRALLACALVLMLVQQAFAWSGLGHQAIGESAQSGLNANAQEGLAKVFDHGGTLAPGTLAKVATWPDEIRNRMAHGTVAASWDAEDTKEADRFNKNHKRNSLWHFVNLPLGVERYPGVGTLPDDPVRHFTNGDDIVQAIKRCVEILESPTATANFTKVQAVRWLVHLVGDIHQPMHVTAGYYLSAGSLAKPKLITDPVAASDAGVIGDRGGNGLLFSSSSNLHAVWDGCLVELANGKTCSSRATEYTPLARKLAAKMKTTAGAFNGTGNHHFWPEQWATDSLKQAVKSHAYPTNLQNGSVQSAHGGDELYMQATIASPAKAAYADAHAPVGAEQLLKAAVRLADVLNAIAWK